MWCLLDSMHHSDGEGSSYSHVQTGEVSKTHTDQHPDGDVHMAVPLVEEGQAEAR